MAVWEEQTSEIRQVALAGFLRPLMVVLESGRLRLVLGLVQAPPEQELEPRELEQLGLVLVPLELVQAPLELELEPRVLGAAMVRSRC